MTYNGQPEVLPNSVPKSLHQTYTVGNDVGVAQQAALGVTVGLLVTGEVPDDQGLVARSGEQHVGAITAVRIPSRRILQHSLFLTSRAKSPDW